MKTVRVGRSSGNDIVIQDDPYVGRTHCQFIQDDQGNYRVIDLDSKNGTYINGVRRSGETRLHPTDTVRIGNQNLPWQSYFRGVGTTYTPPEAPAPVYIEPVDNRPGPGLAIAAMIMGFLGLSLLAIIFAIISLARRSRGKGMAITGLIFGILGMIATIVLVIIWISEASSISSVYYYY